MSQSDFETQKAAIQADIDRIWLEGSNVDLGGPRSSRPAKDDGLGPVVKDTAATRRQELEAMLRDPEVVRELAKRDPALLNEIRDSEMEAVVLAFRRANPNYVPTERNYERILKALNRTHLNAPHLSADDTESELWKAGAYTLANLQAEYEALLKIGRLDVPEGHTRPLSAQEELDLIAAIRAGDIETAITNYVLLRFNGKLPREYESARKFAAAHPDVWTDGVWFCWEQMNAGRYSPEMIRAFRKYMGQWKLLNVRILNEAIPGFVASQEFEAASAQARKVADSEQIPSAKDLEKLSTEEIDRLIFETSELSRQR